MVHVDAVAEGTIPAYRLCTLDLSDNDVKRAGVKVQEGTGGDLGIPEFNNTTRYSNGDTLTIDTQASDEIWEVETASATETGTPLANDGTGKVTKYDPTQGPATIVGYSIQIGDPGDIISVVPFSQISTQWLVNNIGSSSGGSSYTDEQAMDAVGNAMKGTGAASIAYDDTNNQIAVEATDTTLTDSEVQSAAYPVAAADLGFTPATQADLFSGQYGDLKNVAVTSGDITDGTIAQADLAFNPATNGQLFSGQWADVTGKPSSYPPETHGDSAHSANYAKQSDLHPAYTDSDAQNAVLPVGTGDLDFNPATQSELNSVRQGVAHSASATVSGDGSKTTFTLSHNLGSAPSAVTVQATSADAAAEHYVSAKNNNNVEVTFASAPAQGTDNLTFDLVLVE